MTYKNSIAVIALLGVAACAGPGPGDYPAHYQQDVQQYLRDDLKDPYSVRDLSVSPPVRATVGFGADVWKSCVRYNAKNSYGAYVGSQSYNFYWNARGLFHTEKASLFSSDC
jgi:hypothetical protein